MVPHSCTHGPRLYMHLSTFVRVLCSMGSCFSTYFMASPAVRRVKRALTRFWLPVKRSDEILATSDLRPNAETGNCRRIETRSHAGSHTFSLSLSLLPRCLHNIPQVPPQPVISTSSAALTPLGYSLPLAPLNGMQEARTSLVSCLRRAAPPAADKSLKGLERVRAAPVPCKMCSLFILDMLQRDRYT